MAFINPFATLPNIALCFIEKLTETIFIYRCNGLLLSCLAMDLEVKYDEPITSGLYFLPFSIAASISFVRNTFPILPRYLRLYSRSNEGDCLAFYISSAVYFANTISIVQKYLLYKHVSPDSYSLFCDILLQELYFAIIPTKNNS
jgi:hypothetical protein